MAAMVADCGEEEKSGKRKEERMREIERGQGSGQINNNNNTLSNEFLEFFTRFRASQIYDLRLTRIIGETKTMSI